MRAAALLAFIVLSGLPAAQAQDFETQRAAFERTSGQSLPRRAAALRALAAHRTRACVTYLDGVRRKDTHKAIRLLALRLIGEVGVDPAREVLEAVHERGRAEERASALLGLALLRPRVPPDRFLKTLRRRSERDDIRLAAVRALAGYPRPEVANLLAFELAKGDDPLLRLHGRESLRRLLSDEAVASWLIDKGLADPPLHPGALLDLLMVAPACKHPGTGGALRSRLEKGHPRDVRVQAALSLGELFAGRGAQAATTLDVLAPLLKARKRDLVVAGAVAIGSIGPHGKALDAVLVLCASKHASHRALGVGALGAAADHRALRAAIKGLGDEASAVRFAAIATLARQRHTAAVDALVAGLHGARGRRQTELIRALERLTGANMGRTHTEWDVWWSEVRSTFQIPHEEPDLLAAPRKLGTRAVTFYGNAIRSTRLAFLIDVSGSMISQVRITGSTVPLTRLGVCQRELRGVIERLSSSTRFNLIAFANRHAAWEKRAVPSSRRRKKKALAFVDDLRASGGTNIFDPLEAALTDPKIDTVWLLSDGEPTAGRLIHPADILREVRRLNATRRVAIHTISVGRKSDLLARLARENGGSAHVR